MYFNHFNNCYIENNCFFKMHSLLRNNCLLDISYLVLLSLFCSNYILVDGQYESPNHLCGGWFHSTNGSIKFNFTGETNDTAFADKRDQVCMWTINPDFLGQRTGYTIKVQRVANLFCNGTENRLTISHFSLRSKEVTASETWNCGGPQQWVNVPGTVIVVVLTSSVLRNETGFQLEWIESGSRLERDGRRTMYYSWGKHSVDPLPYFAAGFTSNEIATFAFSKGNNTSGYELEVAFDNILFCPNAGLDTCPDNVVLVFGINGDGGLSRLASYEDKQISPQPVSRVGGLFILVWVGDYPRAGLSFQMKYQSVRKKNENILSDNARTEKSD